MWFIITSGVLIVYSFSLIGSVYYFEIYRDVDPNITRSLCIILPIINTILSIIYLKKYKKVTIKIKDIKDLFRF